MTRKKTQAYTEEFRREAVNRAEKKELPRLQLRGIWALARSNL